MRNPIVWAALVCAFACFICCAPSAQRVASTSQPLTATYQRVIVDATPDTALVAAVAADFDQDGIPDFAYCGEWTSCGWYRNGGAGATWQRHSLGQGFTESGATVADIDGNGAPDLATGTWWWPNSAGQFGGPQNMPSRMNDHDMRTGTLQPGGPLYVVKRGEGDNPGAGSANAIYLEKVSTGGVLTETVVEPGCGLNGLELADIDGDGLTDLVVSCAWMRQLPGGAGWERHQYSQWDDFAAISVADLNGDGAIDIVLTISEVNNPSGRASWFQHPADALANGLWTEHPLDTGMWSTHSVAAVDADGDCDVDIVASEYAGTNRFRLYENLGNGNFASGVTLFADGLHAIATADFAGRGIPGFAGCNYRLDSSSECFAYLPTGGPVGCSGTGGGGSGGASSGGSSSGGDASGGVSLGGSNFGGATSGGAANGGSSSGGASSGGTVADGGSSLGGSAGSGGSGGQVLVFGEPSSNGNPDGGNPRFLIAQKATLSQAGTIQKLAFFVQQTGGQLYLALYDSAGTGGNPKNRKAVTAVFTPVLGWNVVSVTTPVALAAGTYWLAHEPSSASLGYPSFSGGNAVWKTQSSFAQPPATFPSTGLTSANMHWSEYGSASVP